MVSSDTWEKFYSSSYISATDLDAGDLTLTISDVQRAEFEDEGKVETKPAIYFEEVEKGFVVNQTNKDILKELFGDDPRAVIGKRVTLYRTKTRFGKKMVDCTRIKAAEKEKPRRATKSVKPSDRKAAK